MNPLEPLARARREKRLHFVRPSVAWDATPNWLDAIAALVSEGDYIPRAPKRSRADRSAGIPEQRLTRLA